MTATTPNVRECWNNGQPTILADLDRDTKFGDLIGMLIQGISYTETGVTPSSNVGTLANIPSQVYDVVATAGTYTGRLKLKIGGPSVLPVPGEAVWGGPGSKTITLSAADAITAFSIKYARADGANCKTSATERLLAQRDT